MRRRTMDDFHRSSASIVGAIWSTTSIAWTPESLSDVLPQPSCSTWPSTS